MHAFERANIVKGSTEIGQIQTHLNASLKYADFGQFLGAVVNDLRLRCFEFSPRIPRSAIGIVETATAGPRMAEGRHHHRRLRSTHPFRRGHAMQDAYLLRYAVVGPGLKLQDKR